MKPKRALIYGVFVASIALILYFSLRSSGPHYQGKSLNFWLEQLEKGQNGNEWSAQNGLTWALLPERTARQIKAADAIRAIGTNSIPYLLQDLAAKDSSFFHQWKKFRDMVKTKWFRKTVYGGTEPTPAERIRWKAALGLEVIGTNAARLVPEIAPLLQSTSSDSAAKSAAYILGGMGTQGIAVLTNAVNSSNDWTALSAMWSMAQHHAIAETNWVPLLMAAITRQTNSTYWALGGLGVWALGEIHLDSEQTIPFLIEVLSSSDPNVRSYAAVSLGKFGKEAKAAVPSLKNLLADSNASWSAKEALKKIQGDEASDSRVKKETRDVVP